jgi:hypothetical protein
MPPFCGYATQTDLSNNFGKVSADAGGTEKQDESDTAVFVVIHNVERESTMTSKSINDEINSVGRTKIGTLSINNNTMDGFALTMTPDYGALRPDSSLDGEKDIPYGIQITKSGTLGEGMTMDANGVHSATVVSGSSATAIPVLSKASLGGEISSATTNLLLDVNIDIASEFRYRKNRFKHDTLYIFVSQSGETADAYAALDLCNKNKMKTCLG